MNAHPHLADILHGSPDDDASSVATIYIVRHGATKLNNQTDTSVDRIRGWKDVPLVEEGRRDARKAALKLKGKDIDAIVSSDLCRASETARIIGKAIGLKVELSHKLRPWNLGKFTGTSTKEALPQIAEYARNKPDTPVPDGESFNQFKARAFEGFAEAIAAHPGKTILIVTHHRDERLIEAWDKAGQKPDHAIDMGTFLQKGDPPGGIKELQVNEAALKGNGQMTPDYMGGDPKQAPAAGEKFSHAEVQYGLAKPGGDKCSACESFHGKDKCDLVVKPIYPGGWCTRFEAKAEGGDEPQQEAAGQGGPRGDMGEPAPAKAGVMAHGRAIAGAKALHAVGHIDEKQRDKHIKASQKAIGGARKPFGAFAP